MNYPNPFRASLLAAAIAGTAHSPAAYAVSTQELERQLQQLQQQVHALQNALATTQKSATAPSPPSAKLEQKVKVLERKQELAEEEAIKNKKEKPTFKAGDKGFSFASADNDFELKVRGYVQADGKFQIDDDPATSGDLIDTFALRRVRPIFEGTLWKHYGFRIMPDFDGGTGAFSLQDAHIDFKHLKQASLRVGKFKGPVGLERLQSGTDIRFVERGLPTNLVPNRDIGAQLYGDLFDGAVSYAAGYFNGVTDRGSSAVDTTDDKEFEGRIFALPFKNSYGPLQGLGLGIGASYGDKNGVAGGVGNFVSQAQNPFFTYTAAGTAGTGTGPSIATTASGVHYRLAPQGYYYWGPFGLLGEYVLSSQELTRSITSGAGAGTTNDAEIENIAWQVQASYVLTGEDNSFRSIKPKNNFDPFAGSWGAWEIVGRYGELDIDDDAFVGAGSNNARRNNTRFADPRASATRATAWGLGLNWYLNNNLRVVADYEETQFDGGRTDITNIPILDRETESALFTRFQVAY